MILDCSIHSLRLYFAFLMSKIRICKECRILWVVSLYKVKTFFIGMVFMGPISHDSFGDL